MGRQHRPLGRPSGGEFQTDDRADSSPHHEKCGRAIFTSAVTKSIVEVGGMHLNLLQVAQNIHNHRTLAALHLFTAIDSPFVAVVLGFDALRIDGSVAEAGRPMLFLRCRAFNSSKAASQIPLLLQRLKWS